MEAYIRRLETPGMVRSTTRRILKAVQTLLPARLVPRIFTSQLALGAAVPQIYRPVHERKSQNERVLTLVSHELSPTGAPKLALQVARACLKDGWKVVVLSPKDGTYRDQFLNHGATVIVDPRTLGRWSLARKLEKLSDAVLCNTIATAGLIRHLRSKAVIWYIHETKYINTVAKSGIDLRALLRQVAEIWASSPMVFDHLVPYAEELKIIGAGVDPVRSSVDTSGSADCKPLRLLVLGSVEVRKGQLILAQACAKLSPQQQYQIEVVFFGQELEPHYANELNQFVTRLPMLRRQGVLLPEQALQELAEADGVVIPSIDEPLSLVAVEAMSAGKIVICSQSCGIAGYLEDDVSAFIADHPSVDKLAATLARAIDARADWPRMSDNAYKVYEQWFSPAAFACRVSEAMDGITSRQAGTQLNPQPHFEARR